MFCYKKIILIFLIILYSKSVCLSKSVDKSMSLELVAILHRHGERTPKIVYKNDPYKDIDTYWPDGLLQLTTKGKHQMYQLGKTFQERYKPFITKYSVQSVHVNSSDADRCHMSAAALLAAWFPPEPNQMFTNELTWLPVPIHSRPKYEDKTFGFEAPCPRYESEIYKIYQEFTANETASDKDFYKFLMNKTGENITTIFQIRQIYSTLKIEESHGYRLPDWTKDVYPDKMREKAALAVRILTWNMITKRLRGGPLVKEIVDRFDEKIRGDQKNMKVFIYSAHDSTMTSVWRALGFEQDLIPDFGASFIFELYQLNKQYFVKMLYMNKTSQVEPNELTIPNCMTLCPVNELHRITKDVIPVNWDEECLLNKPLKYYKNSSSHLINDSTLTYLVMLIIFFNALMKK